MEQNKTEQNTKMNDWLDKELEDVRANTFDGEQLPALTLEEGKVTEFDVDFSHEFDKWVDPSDNTVKKIIPVIHNDERMVFWINIKNPLYRQIIEKGKEGQVTFRVMRTGQRQNTRYTLEE